MSTFCKRKTCSHFFSENISVYAIFNDQSFNNTLTNDIVSFEQLGLNLNLHILCILKKHFFIWLVLYYVFETLSIRILIKETCLFKYTENLLERLVFNLVLNCEHLCFVYIIISLGCCVSHESCTCLPHWENCTGSCLPTATSLSSHWSSLVAMVIKQ